LLLLNPSHAGYPIDVLVVSIRQRCDIDSSQCSGSVAVKGSGHRADIRQSGVIAEA
jgi:hypothetical protein